MLFHRQLNKAEILQRQGFCRDEKGAVILIWALALIPLMAMLGMAIDVGRIYYVHSVITGAADAAAIAGAKAAGMNGDVVGQATAIFNANIPQDLVGEVNAPNIQFSTGSQTVSVSATGTISTTFMKLVGQTSISVSANSQAQISNPGTEIVLALDNTGSMAGSPMAAELEAAKNLVNIVYGGAGIDTVPNLYVAVVPYTTTVNIGAQQSNWLTTAGQAQIKNTNLYPDPKASPKTAASATSVGGSWLGCVEARTPPLYASGMDATDTTPSGSGLFTPFLYPSTMAHKYVFGQPLDRTNPLSTPAQKKPPVAANPPWGTTGATRGDNDWNLDGTVPGGSGLRFGDNYNLQGGNKDGNYAVGPNLGCPVAMLPLTASQTTVLSTINKMKATARGGTMINVGLEAAWWMISPKWQGFWPTVPAGMPKDYNKTNKFVVLMTDGQNQWYDWPTGVPGAPDNSHNYRTDADYTGYGRRAENRSGATAAALNTNMLNMCTTLKNQGVTIYTVLFIHNGSADSATQAVFQQCATDSGKFFSAGSSQALLDAFSNIGHSISSLRLTWPGKP